MNCKNLKQKLNRTLYCKYKKSDIKISECSNCEFKEYKLSNGNQIKNLNKKALRMHRKSTENELRNYQECTEKPLRIKAKSNKLAKLERNRFSIFSDNKDKCYLCPATNNLTWHEIYRGRNRSNSMKYGLCLRLCINCHELYQEDVEFNDYWHKKGQVEFNKTYPDLDFFNIFKRNYL